MFWADRNGGHFTVCALFSSPFNSSPTLLPSTARHSQGSEEVIVDNIKLILWPISNLQCHILCFSKHERKVFFFPLVRHEVSQMCSRRVPHCHILKVWGNERIGRWAKAATNGKLSSQTAWATSRNCTYLLRDRGRFGDMRFCMDELFSLLFCICNAIAFEGPSSISRDGGDSGSNGE